jgi:hypothetical protein
LFRKRGNQAAIVQQLSGGKGFHGRTARAFPGAEDFGRVRGTIRVHRRSAGAREPVAAGVPTFRATGVTIVDTGQPVNFAPVVDLTLRPVAPRTPVFRIQVPRPGGEVLLVPGPGTPGACLHAGQAAA